MMLFMFSNLGAKVQKIFYTQKKTRLFLAGFLCQMVRNGTYTLVTMPSI